MCSAAQSSVAVQRLRYFWYLLAIAATFGRAATHGNVSANDQRTIPLQIRALQECVVRRGWTVGPAG